MFELVGNYLKAKLLKGIGPRRKRGYGLPPASTSPGGGHWPLQPVARAGEGIGGGVEVLPDLTKQGGPSEALPVLRAKNGAPHSATSKTRCNTTTDKQGVQVQVASLTMTLPRPVHHRNWAGKCRLGPTCPERELHQSHEEITHARGIGEREHRSLCQYQYHQIEPLALS